MQTTPKISDLPNDPRDREVVHPAGSPMNGNLATPISASGFTKKLVKNFSAYREGISPTRRGIEVGIAHGFVVFWPFAKLNPLRMSEWANLIGLASAVGLTVILTITLWLYALSNPPEPIKTVTTPEPPAALKTAKGWQQYANGFLVGGILGAAIAYLVLVAPTWIG